MNMITVAFDAMGGDHGPRVTVPAIVQALSHFPELKVIVVGHQTEITHALNLIGYQADHRLTIHHTERAVHDTDKPSYALRHGQNTSMQIAIDLVAQSAADACVSGGNTGALMALSRYALKLLPGIERPALVSRLPTSTGQFSWMLDLGANVACDADSLFQFAIMGAALAEQPLQRNPRVAILNVGAEQVKGNDLVKRCAAMLDQSKAIDFIGYIEGHQLLHNIADVIVCDGFVGNVCLKATEGTAQLFFDKIHKNLMASTVKSWIARKLFASLFDELKTLKPDHYNGASLLGLRGIVIKSHGSADTDAIISAIGEAIHEVKQQVPARISERLEAVLLERHY
ncbi:MULTISPECIES: phosphate acyltransferase PlsX [unclassified Vibrio]|uniref:Phosphate acyltransferase n=1 Tax=Vibrio sp. HB236076 TaxID=3232307 RepID=A0AB39H783_9VIBR|nr:phosphate acyltransferase PlsX [Vibrio sp. HB161653]MDP5253699.1 phosphate acyltransferase PlsX [Vibrio sp. HB161653]